MADQKKLSPVEGIKTASNYLSGPIPEELVDGNSFFGKESIQLLKHHGTYQQDNREERTARPGEKSEKQYSMMVRVRTPGGRLTSEQMLAQLDLGDELGCGNIRLTTRQTVQFHGVVKQNLRELIRRINEIQLSTLAACGDVVRNVMCSPSPVKSPLHDELLKLTDEVVAHFAPRTPAYHEIWVGKSFDRKHLVSGGSNGEVVEPLYGETYLPRKFKIGISLPSDNFIDIYTQDMGFLAVVEGEKIIGYNILVGGSFGVTPANKKTFPALAKRMAFVTPDQLIDVATAVVKVQRDFGNRADRKQARMKYLIAEWGLEKFKAKVEEYYGQPLPDPHPSDVHGYDDHLGWREQGDGLWYYGVNVENGRIHDEGPLRLKTALRKICTELAPPIRLTPHQSILFTDLTAEQKPVLEAILREHGVKQVDEISQVRRWSMACVAWPTCGLAITESERALPGIIDEMEVMLARLGLDAEQFTVRMTGCPNGCARPYNSDIGLVGKAKDRYTLLLGGALLGNRLNTIYKDLVPRDELLAVLEPVFVYFKQDRQGNETFGDFCDRKGMEDLAAWAEQYTAQAAG